MKKNIGKRISGRLRQAHEDMRELQRLMSHRSVYARQALWHARKPKHPKRIWYDYDLGSS